MKEVDGKARPSPLKPELRRFVDWVSGYTLSPRGMVLRMALRMGEHLGPARERVGVRLAGPAPQRLTAARGRVLALLADGLARGKSELAHDAGVSAGVIDGLVDEGTLETLVLPPEPVARAPDPDFAQPDFAPAQRLAADALRATAPRAAIAVDAARRRHRLGQDASVFRGGQRVIRRGRQALVLMPEIALTNQFLDRFVERFGCGRRSGTRALPALRARIWRAVTAGEVKVVIGARSALFLPYADSG